MAATITNRTSDPTPAIFVVDDDASVCTGLDRLLSAAGFRVETFTSAEIFLDRPPHDGIGCIVLDIRMRGLSGTELQAKLAKRGNELPIIFLTGHGSIPLSVNALKQGAADFLTKPVDEKVLLTTIDQALTRSACLVHKRNHLEAKRELLNTLTPREKEVMGVVLTGALNKQIAARLGISEKTVKVHRSRTMEKLSVNSVAELVRFATAAGVLPVEYSEG